MADSLCDWVKNCRLRLKQNSCLNLVWLINFLPTLAGFPLLSKKFNYFFWIIHTVLLFYVVILGTAVYQMYFATGFLDYVNSFFNISVVILISNNSWWILYKRNDLNDLLKVVQMNDDLIIETGRFLDVYQKKLKSIKITVIVCYIFHLVNDVMIYIPIRTFGMDHFSVVSCVGLKPISASPNREACMLILAVQILTAIVAVCSYDVTLLFLFSHTTAVFEILYEEMTSFSAITKTCQRSNEAYCEIEDRLKNIIFRHALALHTVRKLEAIYRVSIGIGFGLDAISMCLFFVLPLDAALSFAPLVYHCLVIFFLHCFQGQRLTTASEKFEIAVYCCGWENLRVKERRQVLLVLKQAQKPVIVYAARVIPICIYTFASTMQFIYKFVTIFKRRTDESEQNFNKRLHTLKETVWEAKRLIRENSFDSLLWIVNIVPNIAGFSCRKDGKISCAYSKGRLFSDTAWFWILHLSLLFYVYAIGSFWFQWKQAQGASDFIKSYVNVTILILTANNSWWFIKQRFGPIVKVVDNDEYNVHTKFGRPLLRAVLKMIDQSDRMARRSISLQQKHEQLMKIIKLIVFIFYGFNSFDGFFIYLPHRADVLNSYSMTPCVGLEPLTVSPNREVCLTILAVQELTIMTVVLNYQPLLLFLIAHTAAMYQMMAYEMNDLEENYNREENKALAKETLSSLIARHSLTLDVVDKLKCLYSVPLGVDFGSNAVCISLFFYLPLQEWLQFMPILVYCFLVFFLYCVLCQRLINTSEVFERSVYCCGWENFDLKEKKLVLVMLRQSQKPVELLAADIIPVNIYTFATTLQAMFKFITVVKF